MGIQIYIKKEAIKHLVEDEICEAQRYCHCDELDGQCECACCGSEITTTLFEYVKYKGLDKLMNDLDDVVWHDANTWGSSRAPILQFIEDNGLVKGTDWYEG